MIQSNSIQHCIIIDLFLLFNSYMDKIFHNFDPSRVVKNWHFHYYLVSTFSHVTLCGLSNDPPPPSSCPRSYWMTPWLNSNQIKSTKLKWISLNFIWFFPNGNDSIWKKCTLVYLDMIFSKMKLQNHTAIAVHWTPTSQDEARTLLPPE